jgi:predicted nucleic acid-binding protein
VIVLETSWLSEELVMFHHDHRQRGAVLRRSSAAKQTTGANEKISAEEFTGRILPFDEIAAREFAQIVASRRAVGHPISQFDAMIAAIARCYQAAAATRNTNDFADCGIPVINPWAA